jgi:hypothetical protein
MAIETGTETAVGVKEFCVTETPFPIPLSGINIVLTNKLIIKTYFYT